MSGNWKELSSESEWEWFVLQNSPVALFQSWAWGEVQRRLGQKLFRYGLMKGKTVAGVAQAVLVTAKRGTFLHVRHGPVLSSGDRSLWEEMITNLSREAKDKGCLFLRISPLLPSDGHGKMFAGMRFVPAALHRMDGEFCWVLDLSDPEEKILSNMRKTTRYEIRRAEKIGVRVNSSRDPKYLADFFSLYDTTSERHGFVQHTGIREEFEVFAKRNQAVLYLASAEGKTLAAAVILYYGNQAIYHHGASVESKVPASYAVQWQAIRDAKKRGIKVYNFWGIAPESSANHPWRGITLFKKGFGGRELEYMHAQDLPLSPFYPIPRAIESARKMFRGYD